MDIKIDDTALKNICRACMTEEGEFQSVFVPDDTIGLNIHLAEMIMAYASVQITLGDGLSEKICSNCAIRVSELYLFKLKCEETDLNLRLSLAKSLSKEGILNKPENLTISCDSENESLDLVIKPDIGNYENSQSNTVTYECIDEIPIERSYSVNEGSVSDDIIIESKALVDHDEDSKEYPCDECEKVFRNTFKLERHKNLHANKVYICDICTKSFTRYDTLARHKKTHQTHNIEFMDDSDEMEDKFETIIPDDIIENYIEIKAEDEFKCMLCDLHCDTREGFDAHILEHKDETTLTCEICKKRFTKSSHLSRHMRIHVSIKPHICHQCNKGFARAEQLANHMNIHSGVKPHVCKICAKGFNQISNLKDHMRTHNGEKPFLCSTCGKGFNQLGNLRQHTVRHSGVKAHLCTVCGNGFASKGELGAHLRKHTGARPFVCQVCNHGFTTSSSLTKHKRIHSGEKPYECEVCKMRFSRSGILARHKRTHTGEKPYVCKFCSKAFSQSNDLSSHLRIHTGEKPYICDVCGQPFRQSSALKTHKKTHADRNVDRSHSIEIDSKVVIAKVHNYGTIQLSAVSN